uniref:ATP synthase subunit a n=1 Tax=Sulcionema specki TaxID=2016126 RepID=A0A6G5ZVB7_9EUGL|nr:ATP synthase F0 subunit a [Sulcionema specki]
MVVLSMNIVLVVMLCLLRSSTVEYSGKQVSGVTYLGWVITDLPNTVVVMCLVAVFSDMDLMATQASCIVMTGVVLVTIQYMVMLVVRNGYTVSHFYVGTGLHEIIRLLLTVIEMVSTLFRVVSLTMRLYCNMLAGHILLSIVGCIAYCSTVTMMYSTITMVTITMSVFMILKTMTCLIQGVVLHKLLAMYYSEVSC